MKYMVSNKVLLYGSMLTFFYFMFLLLISAIDLNVTIIGVLAEMLTIPFLVLLAALTIFSLVGFSKEKFNIRSLSFIAMLLSMATIVLLLIATLFE